jgi:hypothetical protein
MAGAASKTLTVGPQTENAMRFALVSGLGLFALLAPFPAFASGNVPVPETTETLASQDECRLRLTHQRRAHEKMVTPGRALPGRIGDVVLFRELKTGGVVEEAGGAARYDYEFWTHASAWDEAAKKFRISHSYERRSQVCRAGVLTASGSNGYTQPTFADKPLTGGVQ